MCLDRETVKEVCTCWLFAACLSACLIICQITAYFMNYVV